MKVSWLSLENDVQSLNLSAPEIESCAVTCKWSAFGIFLGVANGKLIGQQMVLNPASSLLLMVLMEEHAKSIWRNCREGKTVVAVGKVSTDACHCFS